MHDATESDPRFTGHRGTLRRWSQPSAGSGVAKHRAAQPIGELSGVSLGDLSVDEESESFLLRLAPLAEAGIEQSVGSVGDSYALAESIIGLYKTEVIRPRGPWRGLEAVEFATLEWVDWFNNRWILEPIGHRPPAEAEAAYYRQTEHTALAA